MAAIKRITQIQIGSESCVRLSKFRRVSAVYAGKKVQTGGSLGYYSQKSNGLQDHRPEKLLYDIEMSTSRQILKDSKKEITRRTERLRANLEATNNNLTILLTGSALACCALINEVRSRKPPNVAE